MGGRVSIPDPVAEPTVDYDRHAIDAYVLVLGAEARQHLDALHERTRSADATGLVDLAGPGEASYLYLVLTLGDIRGYSTRLHLYGFGVDRRLATDVERVAGSVAAIIVAHESGGDTSNVMLAARSVASSPRGVPVALIGDDVLGREWTQASGTAPIFQTTPSQDSFSAALKAVAKEVLSSLRKAAPSTAPAPPPGSRPWWKVW